MTSFVVVSFVYEGFQFLEDDGEHADVLRNAFCVKYSLLL